MSTDRLMTEIICMKIGGTGFNLSRAHFQKPTSLSGHGADFHRSL
jgi:hypothetical protein